jgi:hypothetical protein
MRRIQTHFATLSLAAFALAAGNAGAADPAAAPTAVQPAQPVVDGPKITKSRSNIQNNREAPPATNTPKAAPSAPAAEQAVVKTKTKSNQSND